MARLLPVLLAVAAVALVAVVTLVHAQGCASPCANNNQCATKQCSYCFSGYCVPGLQCGASCVVDTDCDQTSSCPLCTFNRCSSPGGPPPPPPPPVTVNSTKACVLNSGLPLCGPINTVAVEHNWHPETCMSLSSAMGYNGYYGLGCINNHSVTVGSANTPPNPDCGWKSGASNNKYSYNKACTAVYNSGSCSGIWDTVIVGYGWSASTCANFTRAYTGYTGSRLGCTFDYFQGGYSLGSSTGAIPPNDCGWASSNAAEAEQHQAVQHGDDLGSGSMICVAYDKTLAYRTTVNASPTWQLDDCYKWVQYTSGSTAIMQVGCIFNSTYSLGARGGGIPSPNCGW